MVDIADLSGAGIGGVRFAALYSNVGAPTARGTGAAPGDRITLTGGSFARAAKVAVLDTQAITATVVAGGSGGANGPVTITGTTGNGTKFQASGTISGGALTGALTVTVVGSYTTNPTSLSVEPVTGGSLVGATVSLTMGIATYQVVDPGNYSVIPANPVAQGSTSGSGTGATFTLSWGTIAAMVDYGILAGASNRGGNLFIGGNANAGSSVPGDLAGSVNSGSENTFVGTKAGGAATTGINNTAVGHNAFGNGAGVSVAGNDNTAVGTDAMRNVGASAGGNVAVGSGALKTVTGSGNVAVGIGTLQAVGSGNDNMALGHDAGNNMTGSQNVFVGSRAANDGTGGGAGNCVVVGYNAGAGLTSGNSNTLLGDEVGPTLKTGSGNILIGTSNAVDTPLSSTSNYLNVGALLYGDLLNKYLAVGLSTVVASWFGIAAGTTAKSQIRFTPGVAPTSPVDGDWWYDGTNLKFRLSGTTKTVTLA